MHCLLYFLLQIVYYQTYLVIFNFILITFLYPFFFFLILFVLLFLGFLIFILWSNLNWYCSRLWLFYVILKFFLQCLNVNIGLSIFFVNVNDLLPCLLNDFLCYRFFNFSSSINVISSKIEESQKYNCEEYWCCRDAKVSISYKYLHE